MTDDVVAELEALINPRNIDRVLTLSALLTRARDEIVAMRTQLEAVKGIAGNERKLSEVIIQQARAEALEEAVQVCIGLVRQFPQCGVAASAIRSLKDKG